MRDVIYACLGLNPGTHPGMMRTHLYTVRVFQDLRFCVPQALLVTLTVYPKTRGLPSAISDPRLSEQLGCIANRCCTL